MIKKTNIPKYYQQLMIYILSLQNKKNNLVDLIKQRWKKLQQKEKIEFKEYKNEDDNG